MNTYVCPQCGPAPEGEIEHARRRHTVAGLLGEIPYRELLLGCGRSRTKRVRVPSNMTPDWKDLTRLDNNPDVAPDVLWDLELGDGLPFDPDTFDEVHAYEVMEHLGAQGNVYCFFRDFFNIWNVLKPGGYLAMTTPSRFSPWLWGDPGHRRFIGQESVHFLSQRMYDQCDREEPTAASDYRHIWKGDFELIRHQDDKAFNIFVLQAVKPAR